MKHQRAAVLVTGVLIGCMAQAAPADQTQSVAVPPTATEGQVDIGAPMSGVRPASPASGTGDGPKIPLIGGMALEPGKPVPVFTTMAQASQAGVNPVGSSASSPAQSGNQASATTVVLDIGDETLWGRFKSLPLGVHVGLVLLLGIGAAWVRELRSAKDAADQ